MFTVPVVQVRDDASLTSASGRLIDTMVVMNASVATSYPAAVEKPDIERLERRREALSIG
jgi:hypothetical protein